eukprot:2882874-Amphidinium_carterae.1
MAKQQEAICIPHFKSVPFCFIASRSSLSQQTLLTVVSCAHQCERSMPLSRTPWGSIGSLSDGCLSPPCSVEKVPAKELRTSACAENLLHATIN